MATHDLFTLLNQLQTVEKTFVNILMEAAIKLSALTESNIFVLVETPEQRKFAGSGLLCQSYIDEGLSCRESDVHLDVDTSRCAVVEKRPARSAGLNLDLPQTKKRGRKRKSISDVDGKSKNRKVLSSEFQEETPVSEFSEENADSSEVIIEDIRSWNNESNERSDEPNERLDEDVNGMNGNVANESSQEVVLDSDHETKYDIQTFHEEASLIHPEADAISVFGAETEMSFSIGETLDETFNGKISALLTLEPTNCFVPQTEEQKLFHSVMYDLARQMVASADVVQYGPNSPMHRAHFKKSLEEFLNTYLSDFLGRVPDDFRITKKGRIFTPMAMIRKSCNDCFRALLRRKFRQACLAANTPVPFTFH